MENDQEIEMYLRKSKNQEQLWGWNLFKNTQFVYQSWIIGENEEGSKRYPTFVKKVGSKHGSSFRIMGRVQERNNSENQNQELVIKGRSTTQQRS